MEEYGAKFNTSAGACHFGGEKCKILLLNKAFFVHSVDLPCDEIMAEDVFRLVACENVDLFEREHLTRLAYSPEGRAVSAAIAYSYHCGTCRAISNRPFTPSAYAATALALYYRRRLAECESVEVASPDGKRRATVSAGGVTVYDYFS